MSKVPQWRSGLASRSKLTPTQADIGKPVIYRPDNEKGVLISINQFGIATYKAKGVRGLVNTDVRNLLKA